MPQNENNIDLLLSDLKDNFLAEIPERCEGIEENILALEDQAAFTISFNELFRSIHSLKGSGGTMGFPVITSISHQFEDLLSEIDGKMDRINSSIVDIMLKYNDLLRSVSVSLANKNFDLDYVQSELDALKLKGNPSKTICLFVEQSKMLSRVVAKEFKNTSVNLVIIENGLVALERLLHENFDYLITSKELPDLNGIALISALRASETKNAKIPCIVTTSKDKTPSLSHLDISNVIKKDKMLAKNLAEFVVNHQ